MGAIAGPHTSALAVTRAAWPQAWRDTAPMLAYDDADIRVVFQPGGSDVLLVTFGDAAILAHGQSFAADTLARKHGLSCLGFMAHRPHWYPVPAMRRALPHLAYTLKSFQRRLLYGSSMGGYAALKHARLLGATDVMAFAPQWSIDAAECAPEVPGYQECFVSSMAGMGIRAEDMAGRAAIFLDPGLASDSWHTREIVCRRPDTAVFHVHHTDHHPGPALAGADAMWGIMRAWLDGDRGRVVCAINQRRRQDPIRTRVLLDRAVGRHPDLALRAMEHAVRARGGQGVDSRRHVGSLLAAALGRGDLGAAQTILHRTAGSLPAVRADVLRQDLGAMSGQLGSVPAGLLTAHGGELCYDAVRGALVAHSHLHPRPPWCHTATLGQAGDDVLLAVAAQDRVLACALDKFGQIELATVGDADRDTLIRARNIGPGLFTLQLGGRYVCALPDGAVRHDREQANAWEVFRLVA